MTVMSQAPDTSAESHGRAAAPVRVLTRRADDRDAAAVRALFLIRCQTDGATSALELELDGPGRMVWVAFDGSRAVGMTSVRERQVRVAGGARTLAYWTGL